MDMEQKDYDSRTALHVAAAEATLRIYQVLDFLFTGHLEVVMFLLEACRVNPFVKDRWGNTPLYDAIQFNHVEVVKVLREYEEARTKLQPPPELEDLSKENLEDMV